MHKFFAKTQFLGKKVLFLPECHSTNEIASDLLKSGQILEGTTVITSHQTQGKGQRGNNWESQRNKNITFSIVIKPNFITAPYQFHLHIITTLAIHQVLFPILGNRLKIKWPNDIYFGARKLGGILIENTLRGAKIESSVIGIGINVNQLDFANTMATSIFELTNEKLEPNDLIEQIIIQLESKYLSLKTNGINSLKQAYMRRLYQYDRECEYMTALKEKFIGKIIGTDPHGKLQVLSDAEIRLFDFKEIIFL